MEEQFLKKLCDEETFVNVFLVNGTRLSGAITNNNLNSFFLARDGQFQLVMKHAVATIMPQND